MSDRPTTHEALPLIEALLDGTIDDAGFARLESMLRDNADVRSLYRSVVNLHSALPAVVGQSPRLSIQITDAGEEELPLDTHEMPHAQLMSLLMQIEATGKPIDPMSLKVAASQDGEAQARDDAGSISTHDMIAAGRYLLRHSFTPKVVTVLATAAALLLGVALMIVLSGEEPTDDPVAIDPNEPIRNATVVATLTAQHDAQWGSTPAERALARGSALHPNQTLTLTAGFAEITTANGAIAIIQAPATIQLINNNALRLHAGKLVGICETDSSKGFTVRTAALDITDLGTRFGVETSPAGEAEVHVFEGEVAVDLQARGHEAPRRKRLVAGQAARVTAEHQSLAAIQPDRVRFASQLAPLGTDVPQGAVRAGVTALTGDVVWSPGSVYIDQGQQHWPADDRAIIFEELQTYRLGFDAPVTLLGPGTTDDVGESLPAHTIPAGTTVRSYIVLLYPASTANQAAQPRGSITFEGEVIGVATHERQARTFRGRVAGQAPLAQVSLKPHQWIDLNKTGNVRDRVAIEHDRQTVTFGFNGSARATDAVRIFVRVQE